MINYLHTWFFPEKAVHQEITLMGANLAVKAGYHVKHSFSMTLLPVHIPECRSYTVEYRQTETGEFEASRDESGNIAIRSRLNRQYRFPVCWLPLSFAGKRVDRYILMVDRKPVCYRAGVGYRRAA